MTRLRLSIPLLLALALTSPAAVAQPRATPTVRSELTGPAREAWDRAGNAIRARIFSTALAEYTSAFELSKNARVLFNMGVCEKELSHYVRASAHWERELREAEDHLTADEKQDLQRAIATVKQFITTVDIKATEPGADGVLLPLAGATLVVDDAEVPGRTPFLAPVQVDSGVDRVLKLRKEGYKDAVRPPQTFRVGETPTLTFTLEPLERRTEVNVRVTGAVGALVVIDGTERGPAPFSGTLLEGPHTFQARAPGYTPTTQTSNVSYKKPLSLVLTLSQERHNGKVSVDAKPAGALIEVDGKAVGVTHWEGTLPSGGHQVIIKKAGYETYSTEVGLSDDQTRPITVELQEAKSRTWIWWTVGTLAVIGGGVVASYFIFKPADATPYVGTMFPGTVSAGHRW